MTRRNRTVPIRLFLCACLFLIIASLFPLPVHATADEPGLSAQAAFVYCIEENQTVLSRNAEQTVYPASSVKIMTGLIACEALSERLDESVTIEKKMLGPSSGYRCLNLKVNDVLTVRDLLYGAICGNDYDACYVLACLVSGSVDVFIERMNQRALELGAANTRYTNPTGVHDPAMTTIAVDTAKVALAAAGNPLYLEISSAEKYTSSGGLRISNRNSLLIASPYRDTRCRGLNTGMTDEGGYCIATVAGNGTYTYLCVLLGVPQENGQYTEVRSLIDWAFSAFGNVELIPEGKKVGSVSVRLSDEAKSVDLYTAGSISGYFPTDILSSPEFVMRCTTESDTLDAPIRAGEEIGHLTLMYEGHVIGSVSVVAKVDVSKSGFLSAMTAMKNLTGRRWIRISLVTAVLLASLYALFVLLYHRNKRFRRRFQTDAYTSMTRASDRNLSRKAKSKATIAPQGSPAVRDRNVPPRATQENQNPKPGTPRHGVNNFPSDIPGANVERRTVYSASPYRSSGTTNVPPTDTRSGSGNRSRSDMTSNTGSSRRSGGNRKPYPGPQTNSGSVKNYGSGKVHAGNSSSGTFAGQTRETASRNISGIRETASHPIRNDRIPGKPASSVQPAAGDRTTPNRAGNHRVTTDSERVLRNGSANNRSVPRNHLRDEDRR